MTHPRIAVAFLLSVAFALLAIAAHEAITQSPAHAGPNCDTTGSIDSQELDFLHRINYYRAQRGLRQLVLSNGLNRSAQWKARHMADNDYGLAHDDPGLRTWTQRIRDCGYNYPTFHGEILTGGESTGASAFNIWHNSPDHDEQMLGPDYRAIGIGRASNGGGSPPYFWAVDFGGVLDARIVGGDVDCNGRIDSVDASLLLQHSAGLVQSLDCEAEADADNDGRVSATDALLILQYAAGLVG